MRLIDAEAYETDVRKRYCKHCDNGKGLRCRVCWINDMLGEIENAPTVEEKPVEHAHWREFYPPKEFILTGEEKLYICSNCDAKYSDIENQRFCPWCGVQMDEEASE